VRGNRADRHTPAHHHAGAVEGERMQLRGDRLTLSRNGRPLRPWRVVTYSSLILIGVAVLWLMETGRVQPLFLPTSTPPRRAGS